MKLGIDFHVMTLINVNFMNVSAVKIALPFIAYMKLCRYVLLFRPIEINTVQDIYCLQISVSDFELNENRRSGSHTLHWGVNVFLSVISAFVVPFT